MGFSVPAESQKGTCALDNGGAGGIFRSPTQAQPAQEKVRTLIAGFECFKSNKNIMPTPIQGQALYFLWSRRDSNPRPNMV